MPDLRHWMQQGRISPAAAEQLGRFVDLILQWNPRINLTGFRNRGDMEDILVGECVAALSVLNLSGRSVLDFGSGAGIPGLVWAACDPSIRVTSLEIRQKKAAFQKEVLRETGLEAEILCGRFPEAVAGRHFDVIVTRAIRFEERLWEAAGGLLNPDGLLVRFASREGVTPGWRSLPVSERTWLLLKP